MLYSVFLLCLVLINVEGFLLEREREEPVIELYFFKSVLSPISASLGAGSPFRGPIISQGAVSGLVQVHYYLYTHTCYILFSVGTLSLLPFSLALSFSSSLGGLKSYFNILLRHLAISFMIMLDF